jgi:hypothetical protein
VTSDPAARLRDAGPRVTAARMAVIRALEALGGHRTADEIGAALGTGGAAIPCAAGAHVDRQPQLGLAAAMVGVPMLACRDYHRAGHW